MELYDAIFSARNTHKFKSKTIPYSKLFAIIEAGYAANAIGNVPSAKIVIVETESIRNKISAISGHNWISSAPVLLVVCSDNGNLKKLYDEKNVSKYSVQNSAAATQNILLAAREFGIQGSWISDFSEKRIASLLSIPSKIQVHNLIALGFSDQHFDRTAHKIAYDRTFYEEWKSRKRADKTFPLIKKKHVSYIRNLEAKIDKKLITTHEKLVKKIGKTIKHFK